MGRRIFFLCLCLVLGAISTVAVAWTAVLARPAEPKVVRFEIWGDWNAEPHDAGGAVIEEAWGLTEEFCYADRRKRLSEDVHEALLLNEEMLLNRMDRATRVLMLGRIGDYYGMVHEQTSKSSAPPQIDRYSKWRVVTWAGWPMRSMNTDWFASQRDWSAIGWLSDRVVRQPPRYGCVLETRALMIPLRPVVAGFALDTAFYAAAWWMLLAAPFALRRLIRRKRGLCAVCGYDLRGRGAKHERCPECGAAIGRKATTVH